MPNDKLDGVKPCPFCGGTNIETREGSTFRWVYAACNECDARAGEVRMSTLGNGTREQRRVEADIDAMKEWNRRYALPETGSMKGRTFDAPEQPCLGCGKPLLIDNAWMDDGCPCNTPAGVNNLNLYRWRLLHELQQRQYHEKNAISEHLERMKAKVLLAADDEIMRQESARSATQPIDKIIEELVIRADLPANIQAEEYFNGSDMATIGHFAGWRIGIHTGQPGGDYRDTNLGDPEWTAKLIAVLLNYHANGVRPTAPVSTTGSITAEKDEAYRQRNVLVATLARMYPSGIRYTCIPGWSSDWHGCCFIDLPSGQISYHYHDSQAHLFDGLPPYTKEWDGHDKKTVEDRLLTITACAPVSATGTPSK